ncbi:hypothetical protein HK405_005531 [Cladochytrium tenue]|nr:hypothetical protein HK405_005531 [Cladochytrium tenue]
MAAAAAASILLRASSPLLPDRCDGSTGTTARADRRRCYADKGFLGIAGGAAFAAASTTVVAPVPAPTRPRLRGRPPPPPEALSSPPMFAAVDRFLAASSTAASKTPGPTLTSAVAELVDLLRQCRDQGDPASAARLAELLEELATGADRNEAAAAAARELARVLVVAAGVHGAVQRATREERRRARMLAGSAGTIDGLDGIVAAAGAVRDLAAGLLHVAEELDGWQIDDRERTGNGGTGSGETAVAAMGRARVVLADVLLRLAEQARTLEICAGSVQASSSSIHDFTESMVALRRDTAEAATALLQQVGPGKNGGEAPPDLPALQSLIVKAELLLDRVRTVSHLLENRSDDLDFTIWAQVAVRVAANAGVMPPLHEQSIARSALRQPFGSALVAGMTAAAAESATPADAQLLGRAIDAMIAAINRDLIAADRARSARGDGKTREDGFADDILDAHSSFSSSRMSLVKHAISACIEFIRTTILFQQGSRGPSSKRARQSTAHFAWRILLHLTKDGRRVLAAVDAFRRSRSTGGRELPGRPGIDNDEASDPLLALDRGYLVLAAMLVDSRKVASAALARAGINRRKHAILDVLDYVPLCAGVTAPSEQSGMWGICSAATSSTRGVAPLPLEACVRRWDAVLRYCAAASHETRRPELSEFREVFAPASVVRLMRAMQTAATPAAPAAFLPGGSLFNVVIELVATCAPAAMADPLVVARGEERRILGRGGGTARSERLDACLELAASMERSGHSLTPQTYAALFQACEVAAVVDGEMVGDVGGKAAADNDSGVSEEGDADVDLAVDDEGRLVLRNLDGRLDELERRMQERDRLAHSHDSMHALLVAVARSGGSGPQPLAQRIQALRASGAPVPVRVYAGVFEAAGDNGDSRVGRWVLDDAVHGVLRTHPWLLQRPTSAASEAMAAGGSGDDRAAVRQQLLRGLLCCAAGAGDVASAWRWWRTARVLLDDAAVARDARMAAALVRGVVLVEVSAAATAAASASVPDEALAMAEAGGPATVGARAYGSDAVAESAQPPFPRALGRRAVLEMAQLRVKVPHGLIAPAFARLQQEQKQQQQPARVDGAGAAGVMTAGEGGEDVRLVRGLLRVTEWGGVGGDDGAAERARLAEALAAAGRRLEARTVREFEVGRW